MSAPAQIALASGNPDKASELAALLAPAQLLLAPADFDPEETGVTLLQNALVKAEALRERLGEGMTVLADDSGLVVHALGGRPGVFSARYAGPEATYADNCRRLLEELDGVQDRAAAFVCVLAALRADGDMAIASGCVAGEITRAMRGANGFGYDPVFQPLGWSRTMAEVDPSEKATISHRGRAARRMAQALGLAGAAR